MASDSAGPVPNQPGPAPHESRSELRRSPGARRAAGGSRRSTFRAWRRSRPFWGGLLLLLAGLEMLLIPLTGVLAKGQIKLVIYVGVGGIFGILIGALLIACGFAIWFNRAHKTFYSIAGVLLAILSFIGTNLGGFFIGMLLGIVGGALAFGWTPTEPEASDEILPLRPPRPEPPSEGVGLILGDSRADDESRADDDTLPGRYAVPADQSPEHDDEQQEQRRGEGAGGRGDEGAPTGPRHRSRGGSGGGRIIASMAVLALAAGTLITGGRASAAEVAPARSGTASNNCILFVICSPSSPSPSPSPSPTTSGGSGSGGSGGSGSGTSPISGLLPSGSASGGSTGSAGPAGSGNSKGTKNKKTANKNKKASATAGLVVSSSPTVLTADSATLDGLSYQGVVNMPVAGGGTVKMMKFTMSSQSLTTATQTSSNPGNTLTTKLSSATFSGSVVLYATKLSGKLLGVPITLSPGNVVSVLLQVLNSLTPLVPVTMTGVTADQPVVLANSATVNGLVVSAS